MLQCKSQLTQFDGGLSDWAVSSAAAIRAVAIGNRWVGEQQILWLDVSMDDVLSLEGTQSPG